MKRLSIGLSVLLALFLSIAVFRITYQVDALEKELRSLNKEILNEQETIHILQAEWSYLNDPHRLQELAQRHLGLSAMRGEQLINFDLFDKQLLIPDAGLSDSDATPVKMER